MMHTSVIRPASYGLMDKNIKKAQGLLHSTGLTHLLTSAQQHLHQHANYFSISIYFILFHFIS
jgi:hypothetical protein